MASSPTVRWNCSLPPEVAGRLVSTASVYARRIALIDNYLNGLRNKGVQLAQKRGPVPRLRLVSGSRGEIVIDGKLDDEPWRKCPIASTGRLRELQTGRQPIFGTSIKTAWIGERSLLRDSLRGSSPANGSPNIATTKNGDQAIWYGDVVEILLDTDSHSYYQIAVNPAGAVGRPRSRRRQEQLVPLGIAGRSRDARGGRSLDGRDPHPGRAG